LRAPAIPTWRMRRIELSVTWSAIFKVLAALLLAYVAVRLWPLIELVILALLIAIPFFPLLLWTEKHGWPHWSGVLLCALILFGLTLLFFGLLVPTTISEGADVIGRLPSLKQDVLGRLAQFDWLRQTAERLMSSPGFSNPEPLVKQFVAWGTVALTGLAEFFLVLIVAVYFVADGQRAYSWILALFPKDQRRKMADASGEIVSVAARYMVGQLITSVLCGGYVFVVLTVLHVPNAGILAIVAAVFDVLPLLGFFLFTIPAVLLALTISPVTALLVAILYLVYHLFENYFIVPKVYGDALKLSTLTVLLSCLAAALLAGIVGVIIVLPVVATYPIVERIWLRPYLQPDTVPRHDEIERTEQD